MNLFPNFHLPCTARIWIGYTDEPDKKIHAMRYDRSYSSMVWVPHYFANAPAEAGEEIARCPRCGMELRREQIAADLPAGSDWTAWPDIAPDAVPTMDDCERKFRELERALNAENDEAIPRLMAEYEDIMARFEAAREDGNAEAAEPPRGELPVVPASGLVIVQAEIDDDEPEEATA